MMKDDDMVYTLLNIIEVIPLACFVICLLFKRRALNSKVYRDVFVTSKRFWKIIFSFFVLVLVSVFVNTPNIASSITHFVVLIRFIPFAYFVVLFGSSNVILRHIKIASFILLFIGVIEVVFGPSCYSLFLPATKLRSSSLYNENDIFGIYPNAVDYAYLLLAFFILHYSCVFNNFSKKLFLLVLYSVLIYYTGSKTALLVAILIILLVVPRSPVLKVFFLIIGILIASYFIYDNFELFYWTVFEDSMYSRGGLLLVTLPGFLNELSLNTFIGVTSDCQLAFDKISSLPNPLLWIQNVEGMTAFEDCFYVALIIYYGMIGFGILVYLFVKVYMFLINQKYTLKSYDCKFVIRSLFLCLLILPLVGQILIIRTFSFMFWTLMAVMYSNINLYNFNNESHYCPKKFSQT